MPTQEEIPVAIGCLLLAAGSSQRMGQNKLSLPLSTGATVLEQTALNLARAPLLQHVLVLRDRESLSFSPEAFGFSVVEIGNQGSLGMHRSLKMGLSQMHTAVEAVMVCLGDQPFVTQEDYVRQIGAYIEALSEGRDLLFPIGGGRRGNPAIIHRRYFEEILAEPDRDQGCRYLFERYPDRVSAWEAPSSGFFRDLDTPEEYRACLN